MTTPAPSTGHVDRERAARARPARTHVEAPLVAAWNLSIPFGNRAEVARAASPAARQPVDRAVSVAQSAAKRTRVARRGGVGVIIT
jgi:hypothetical protein